MDNSTQQSEVTADTPSPERLGSRLFVEASVYNEIWCVRHLEMEGRGDRRSHSDVAKLLRQLADWVESANTGA